MKTGEEIMYAYLYVGCLWWVPVKLQNSVCQFYRVYMIILWDSSKDMQPLNVSVGVSGCLLIYASPVLDGRPDQYVLLAQYQLEWEILLRISRKSIQFSKS